MVNAVMGCSGPAPGLVSSLVARMSLMRKRSDGEQRDWEMLTKSRGSGTMTTLSAQQLPALCYNEKKQILV